MLPTMPLRSGFPALLCVLAALAQGQALAGEVRISP
jgi:hypothetical protein